MSQSSHASIPITHPSQRYRNPNYGVRVVVDDSIKTLINHVKQLSPDGPFDHFLVIRSILYPQTTPTTLLTSQQLDTIAFVESVRRAMFMPDPTADYVDLVYQVCTHIVSSHGRIATALGYSTNLLPAIKPTANGIDHHFDRFREVFAIQAAREKFATAHARGGNMTSLAEAILTDWHDKAPDHFNILTGPLEPDGRCRDGADVCQIHMLSMLLDKLFDLSASTGTTSESRAFKTKVKLESTEIASKHPLKQQKLFTSLAPAGCTQIFRMAMETLASKAWVYQTGTTYCVANYFWDYQVLVATRKEFGRVSVDSSGAKISGSYMRIMVAWTFLALSIGISVAAGASNWAGRTTVFERVNDAFSNLLLCLALPAFTVKIMSHSGDQALRDWLTGCIRVSSLEQVEDIILRRLVRRWRLNPYRAVIAINRVKCETDMQYNWTAPHNLCYKPGRKDGIVAATRPRSAADLEAAIGIDGPIARSWIAPLVTSYVLGGDVNHLSFGCAPEGSKMPSISGLFVSQYPLKQVFFS